MFEGGAAGDVPLGGGAVEVRDVQLKSCAVEVEGDPFEGGAVAQGVGGRDEVTGDVH